MTDHSKDSPLAGKRFGSQRFRNQLDDAIQLADIVHTDSINVNVHAKQLLEALEDLLG